MESWSRKYRVHGHEAGRLGTLKFGSLLNYFQDIAEAHAQAMDVSIDYLQRQGLLWVLSRYHVQLLDLPKAGDELLIATWPSGWERLFAVREFEVFGVDGRQVARASSAWLVISAQTHYPVNPRKHLPEIPCEPRRALEAQFDRLPALTKTDNERVFVGLMHDLDVNGHINNAVYAVWALEAVEDQQWVSARPMELEIQFQSMAFAWQKVISRVQQIESAVGETRYLHSLVAEADGRELVRARSRWEHLSETE